MKSNRITSSKSKSKMRILDFSLDTKLKEFNASYTHTFSLAKYLSKHNELFLIIGGNENKITKIFNLKVLTTRFNPPVHENPFLKFIKLIYNPISLIFKTRGYWKGYEVIYERCRIGMFAGLILSKILRIPLVYEVNGILDEEMYESTNIKNKFLQNIISRLYKAQLKNAKVIIVQTKELKNIIRNKWDINNIFVVENGVNPINFTKKRKKDKKIKLVFVGSLDMSHSLNSIFDSISKIKDKFKFFIIGDGELKEDYINKYSNDKRFLFMGKLLHKNALNYIMNSDICIASYNLQDSTFKKHGFYFCPLKLLEYSIAGKPTIMYSLSNSFTKIFEKENACFVVNSKDEFIKKLKILIKDSKLRKKMGKNAKKIAKEYTWENSAKKTEIILKDTILKHHDPQK